MPNPKFIFYKISTDKVLYRSVKIFGLGCWVFYYSNGFGWFRLFGKGLKWKDRSKFPGDDQGLRIGKWEIKTTCKKLSVKIDFVYSSKS
jgi:hypothetical protein